MWTNRSACLFSRAMASYVSLSKIHRRRYVLDHLLRLGLPKLAKKFDQYLGESRNISLAIEKAKAGYVCPCCNIRFPADSPVCKLCGLTNKGRQLRRKFHGERIRRAKAAMSDKAKASRAQRYRRTCLGKYGVDNALKVPEVRKKMRTTNLRRYGVPHAIQSQEIQERSKETNIERYSVPYSSQSENNKSKSVATNLRKRGVPYASQDPRVVKRCEATNLRRYGVRRPSQNLEILQKSMESAHKVHTVVCGGKEYKCQGYERFVLPKLVAKFGPDDVLGQYEENRAIRIDDTWYRPDAYVRHNDTFVEVKSTWTLLGRHCIRKNRRISEYLDEQGIRLKILIYFVKDDKVVVMPKTWYRWSRSDLTLFIKEKLNG